MAHSSTLPLLSLSVFSPSTLLSLSLFYSSSIPLLSLSLFYAPTLPVLSLSLFYSYSIPPSLSRHLSPFFLSPPFSLPHISASISRTPISLPPLFVSSAMLEVSSSLSPSMVRFCTGELSVDCLASLAAQNLDYILASAPTLPPPPCIPPKSFNGECPPFPRILLFIQSPISYRYLWLDTYFEAFQNVILCITS